MGYDLPNKSIVPIEKTVTGKEESLLHLVKGAPADFAAGTLIRQHAEGATFNWAGSFYAEAGKEVSCTVKLKGVSCGYAESGKFWPGSKTFQLVLAPIGPVSKEKPLLIRKITLEKITRVK